MAWRTDQSLYWPPPEMSQSFLTKAFLFSSRNWLGMRPVAPPTTLPAWMEIGIIEIWSALILRIQLSTMQLCQSRATCACSPATSWGPPCLLHGESLPWRRPDQPLYRGSGCLWSGCSWNVASDKPTVLGCEQEIREFSHTKRKYSNTSCNQ